MLTYELQGRITENGQLEVQLPDGLPVGEVTVRIEVQERAANAEQQSWTVEELRDLMVLMTPSPQNGSEIAAWLEANPPVDPNWGGITSDEDVAEYVHNMRRKKHHGWG